jgi:1-phosphofructokinase/tagatose 6-phosphate kinase
MNKGMMLTVCLNPTLQNTYVLPQLAIGEVNRVVQQRLDASGKGINVTRVIHQLGHPVLHLTQCGGWTGRLFLELAKKDGLRLAVVKTESAVRFCHTLISSSQKSVTEIVEEGAQVSPAVEEGIRGMFLKKLPGVTTVIISGSKAKGFSDSLFPWMVKTAKADGKRVIVDFRGKDLISSLEYKPDIIKPNLSEFFSTFFPETGCTETEQADLDEEMIRGRLVEISTGYSVTVICTRGPKGVLAAAGKLLLEQPAQKINVLNSIGCGDAFTAGLAVALESGYDLQQALEEGIRCASLNALYLKPGTIRPD